MIEKTRKLVEINQLFLDQQEEYTTNIPENVAVAVGDGDGDGDGGGDSSLSGGDEAYEVNTPSPKKRKGSHKKVITIPIGEGDQGQGSSRSKGEVYVYPPQDSWSWRKYGQKPIKGSPYPRGYYRCSSSKGCSARKQVERSRHDPTMLLITYTCDHNHSLPTSNKHNHHHHHRQTATTSEAVEIKSTSTTSTSSSNMNESTKEEFAAQDFDSENIRFSEFVGEMGWFSGVMESTLYESSILMGPTWSEIDKVAMLKFGEEDELLFGDLGELPECSTVFRRVVVGETPCGAAS